MSALSKVKTFHSFWKQLSKDTFQCERGLKHTCRDQPNSRSHGHGIFHETGSLPCGIDWL